MWSKTRNATIMVLCSDSGFGRVLQEALESEGYSVIAAQDVGTAVDRLKQHTHRPDLLIVRHYVNGMEGHDAALYLRKKCPGLGVLIVGGLIDDDRLRYREEVQGFEVFPKPFAAAELLLTVKEMLAQHHAGIGLASGSSKA